MTVRASCWIVLVLSAVGAVGIAGCATGGGDGDRGMVRIDGGGRGIDAARSDGGIVPGIDASLPMLDSTVPGLDAGPMPIDAFAIDGGPMPIDAGAARDAGPTPVDGGPRIDSGTTPCSESPCRLVSAQCGCAASQACYLSGATRMCATAGTSPEGATCATSSSCAPGTDCFDFSTVAGRTARQCARYCGTDADCMGAGSLCVQTLNDGAGGTIPGVRLCSRSCNPIGQTGCASGLACNVYQESAGARRFLTDCAGPTGGGTQFDPCSLQSDCAAGFSCVAGSCEHWCNVATDSGCGFLEICSGFSPPVIVGGVEYGTCY